MERDSKKPLVSVCVITYNSSEFVLETLESIKNQTYKNIELIISDDCSTDNTMEICRNWLQNNAKFFVDAKMLTSPYNTGIVFNDNRAIAACNGDWVKLIAGDDFFLPEAIEKYVDFVTSNAEIKCCFARSITFGGSVPKDAQKKEPMFLEKLMYGEKSTAKKQFNILIHTFAGSGNTSFINKEIFDKLGDFDDRFPMQEDHAFFIKVTKAGYKFYLLDENTVYYRRNPNSVCRKGSEGKLFTPQEVRYIQQYKYEYCMEHLWWSGRMMLKYSLWIRNKVINSGNNPTSLKCQVLYQFYRITDPINWTRRLIILLDKIA